MGKGKAKLLAHQGKHQRKKGSSQEKAGRNSVVSRSFRDAALKAFPQLSGPPTVERRRWLAFLDLLCFSAFLDEGAQNRRVVISRAEILRAIGLPERTHSRKFNAKAFLDEIVSKGVLNKFRYLEHGVVTYGGKQPVKSKARIAITNFGSFKAVLDQELTTFHKVPDEDRVYLVSGGTWKATSAKELRDADLSEATADAPLVSEAKEIADYLNELPSNLFTKKINANIDSAIAIAAALPEPQRSGELAKLHRIIAQPQPFYGPSKEQKTVRLFAKGVSIQGLSNPVKAALTAGWVTFDLRSAQLAIIAEDWGITELAEWLSIPTNSIWSELCSLFPAVAPGVAKSAIKTAVYSVCYGGTKTQIEQALAADLMVTPAAAEKFFEHRFVAAILNSRSARMKKIRGEGGATDCFGHRIACPDKGKARSVLAQLSQAREMQLLLPAVRLAKKRRKEVTIVLWEHDGFSVHFTRKDRVADESERIRAAVGTECRRRGYPTWLEEKPHRN